MVVDYIRPKTRIASSRQILTKNQLLVPKKILSRKTLQPKPQNLFDSSVQVMVTVLQNFIKHSNRKFADMKHDAQEEWTNFLVPKVDAWKVSKFQHFTDIEICGRHIQMLYTDHYRKNLFDSENQFFGTTRSFQ